MPCFYSNFFFTVIVMFQAGAVQKSSRFIGYISYKLEKSDKSCC